MMLLSSEGITAGQAVILVAIAFGMGSSGPNNCEDFTVLLFVCDGDCASAGLMYGALSYFKVNACGGIVDGSGMGSFGLGYGYGSLSNTI